MKTQSIFPFFLLPLLASAQISNFAVYPGDTNNDSIVNVRDLLPIGIAFFQETLPRPFPPSTDWAPQPAEGLDFLTLPVTSVNFAHIDADGNGFIDSLDSEIIALNYDSIAAEDLPPSYQPGLPATPVPPYCPYLRLAFDRDTAVISDTFFLDIFLEGFPKGTALPEPEGILGVAFSLKYDPANVKDSLTRVFPDTIVGDLMFVHATFNRAAASRAIPSGQIDFAAAGYGENALRSDRRLGRVAIIVEDMIFRTATAVPFSIGVVPSSVLMLNRDEAFFFDCPHFADTIMLFDPASSAFEPRPEPAVPWFLYPNPARDACTIGGSQAPERARLFDVLGRELRKWMMPALGEDLGIGSLPPGMYFLEVRDELGAQQVLRLQMLH